MSRAEVAVIGGGSTGSSILYHLAKRGVKDAVLLERGQQIAAGQTSRSTALVRTHYSVPVVARMALNSYRFFKDFEKNLPGRTAGYVETGLIIGADESTEKELRDNVGMLRGLGIATGLIDRDEARRLEPNLDTRSFTSMVYEPQMGYAEPSTTASAFASAAQEMGARVMTGTQALSISREGGAYSVSTSNGTVSARKVVLATGVWSPPIFRSIGVDVPIKPVRHPVAIYRRPEEYQGNRPVIFDFPRSAYYKPEGRYLFFVGSMEYDLDQSSQGVDPDNYPQDVTFDEVTKLSAWTAEAIPLMGSKGVYERGYTGVYDITPDQQPVIDELSEYGLENLYCLVGLSGHGFKLCPEFGRVMASLVDEGSFSDYDVSVFRLGRFREGKLLTGRYRIGTVG